MDTDQRHGGRFAGRPSRIKIRRECVNQLLVSGEVWPVLQGVPDLNAMQWGGWIRRRFLRPLNRINTTGRV